MSSSTPYTLTTAIDYVNAPPHVGHAYEKIAADVMCRFKRLTGNSVFFLTGTDEHGMKVEKTAATRGLTPKEHVDDTVRHFKDAWDLLNIQYDRFIRTTAGDFAKLLIEDRVDTLGTPSKPSKWIVENAFERAFCRPPTPHELEVSLQFVDSQTKARTERADAEPYTEAVTDFCQVLFGLNEFIYVD